jgi:hypothetical protein
LLRRHQLGEQAVAVSQLFEAAALDDAALAKDEGLVSVADSGQPVGSLKELGTSGLFSS